MALKAAGYAALIERFGLKVIPNWHESFIASSGSRHAHTDGDVTKDIFPSVFWPGDTTGAHLEFALKYDGTNLSLLDSLFEVVDEEAILEYVQSKPTGKYARRIWFLYEFLTGKRLPLEDLRLGNYIDLLDGDQYYTTPGDAIRRQRINENLLGARQFCPLIRRTAPLRELETADIPRQCEQLVSAYSPELLKRALKYLYTKETKSSFEIEHITPNSTRTERFVALLQSAEREDFCDKHHFLDLQNRIVDPRFRDTDYRKTQNYVGESVAWQREKVHFVGPKPENLVGLMSGLVAAHQRLEQGQVFPVVHAAAVAYGFVFLHPFEDGNGRIHRFLIHNVLARRGFTSRGMIFPISAAMLKHSADYDASLEAFSRPLMELVDYSLDTEGQMTVLNDTARWYRYIDMTAQVEALSRFIRETIDTELVAELAFLANYDQTKEAIQGIVDMPDRQIDLFIRYCLQNKGRLSANKRSQFSSLSDDEIARMEQAIRVNCGKLTFPP